MSQKFEKLKTLLKELFQLDQPDLDFGLYRIMHVKSAEVTQFLDKDLLPQVKQAFGLYKTADKAELEKELAKAIEQAQSLGADPETLPKVKELRAKLANDAVDIGGLENEVYDHLYSFFRRYYSEGDFLAKRVYRPGVYAIPYEGEEVKLHWANRDQYYIKTSEYLRDYAFRLKPDDAAKPMRVHFRLVDAAEGEHGNIKAAEGKDRVFILAPTDFIAEEDGELVLRFAYRPATLNDWPENEREGKKKPPAQKDLTASAVSRILAVTDAAFTSCIAELAKPHVNLNGETPGHSRLEGHLKRYTARNTFDYFIHKDLGGFLRRELDFYVKNEVMHLDDIESDTAPRVEQYLSKIKVIRRVAGKVIDFLAQLEDFQKKLWLKKKFAIETRYLIRVDTLPETFLPTVANNEAQREEWVRLFGIESLPGYTVPMTPNFVRELRSAVIDTNHFEAELVENILAEIPLSDEIIAGVLIHSENTQAISLISDKCKGSIECIHIDPPYNTQTSGFLYKNAYQHSSWLTMMSERIALAQSLLSRDGSLLCHIDENENERLHALCDELALANGGTIVWDKRNPMLGRKGVATQHEYVLWRTDASGPLYLRNANQRLILSTARRLVDEQGGVNDVARRAFAAWIARAPNLSGGERLYKLLEDDGRVYRGVAMGAPELRTDPKFFIPLEHPITKRKCPVPSNGWSRAPETLKGHLERGEIMFGQDETTQPQLKVYLTDDSQRQVPSIISESARGKADMDALGLTFPYCHPLSLYVELVGAAAPSADGTVLDYFAGSGTNGHAVIALNRDEGTSRKFVLVEAGDQFDDVLLPRLKKATYSPEWDAARQYVSLRPLNVSGARCL